MGGKLSLIVIFLSFVVIVTIIAKLKYLPFQVEASKSRHS